MKKRTKIIIASVLIFFVLTALHYFYGLFTPYNYLIAKWDISHNNPRILQYGEGMKTDDQAIKISPRFGFTYDVVAGCEVTTPFVNGVNAYNSTTTDYLNNKLGRDWKKKFDFQVDSLFREERADTIRKIVHAIDKVKELDDYLDSVSNGKEHLYIWVLPQNESDANVRVCRKMADGTLRVFYNYKVDPYSLEASLIQY